ncbi:MAG: hypothetical protein ACTSVI_15430 [Promethearchaeota archaeon]
MRFGLMFFNYNLPLNLYEKINEEYLKDIDFERVIEDMDNLRPTTWEKNGVFSQKLEMIDDKIKILPCIIHFKQNKALGFYKKLKKLNIQVRKEITQEEHKYHLLYLGFFKDFKGCVIFTDEFLPSKKKIEVFFTALVEEIFKRDNSDVKYESSLLIDFFDVLGKKDEITDYFEEQHWQVISATYQKGMEYIKWLSRDDSETDFVEIKDEITKRDYKEKVKGFIIKDPHVSFEYRFIYTFKHGTKIIVEFSEEKNINPDAQIKLVIFSLVRIFQEIFEGNFLKNDDSLIKMLKFNPAQESLNDLLSSSVSNGTLVKIKKDYALLSQDLDLNLSNNDSLIKMHMKSLTSEREYSIIMDLNSANVQHDDCKAFHHKKFCKHLGIFFLRILRDKEEYLPVIKKFLDNFRGR